MGDVNNDQNENNKVTLRKCHGTLLVYRDVGNKRSVVGRSNTEIDDRSEQEAGDSSINLAIKKNPESFYKTSDLSGITKSVCMRGIRQKAQPVGNFEVSKLENVKTKNPPKKLGRSSFEADQEDIGRDVKMEWSGCLHKKKEGRQSFRKGYLQTNYEQIIDPLRIWGRAHTLSVYLPCSQLPVKHRHRYASALQICHRRGTSIHSRFYPLLPYLFLLYFSEFSLVFQPPILKGSVL